MWTLALCDRLGEAADALDAVIADARTHGSALGYGIASCFRSNVHYRAGMLIDAEADARAALEWPGSRTSAQSAARHRLSHRRADRPRRTRRGERNLARVEATIKNADSIAANPFLFNRGGCGSTLAKWSRPLADLHEVGRGAPPGGHGPPRSCPGARPQRPPLAASVERDEARPARRRGARPRARVRSTASPGDRALRRGRLARGQRAIERLAEASSVLERSPAQLERARVLVEYGAALRRANRRAAARAQLRDGLLLAERCGAAMIAEHARDELAATGARPRRAEYRHELTPSERRVAQMAATGLGNREIAQALFVTEKTVEWHLSQVYRKLDVRSRHDLPRALGEADTLAPASRSP